MRQGKLINWRCFNLSSPQTVVHAVPFVSVVHTQKNLPKVLRVKTKDIVRDNKFIFYISFYVLQLFSMMFSKSALELYLFFLLDGCKETEPATQQ